MEKSAHNLTRLFLAMAEANKELSIIHIKHCDVSRNYSCHRYAFVKAAQIVASDKLFQKLADKYLSKLEVSNEKEH